MSPPWNLPLLWTYLPTQNLPSFAWCHNGCGMEYKVKSSVYGAIEIYLCS